MSQEQTLPVEVEFAGLRCQIIKTTYAYADATAVLLVDAADGSPVTTASVNVAGVSEHLNSQKQFVLKSYSENEGLLEALQDTGVVEDTGRRVQTDFVECPVVRLIEPSESSSP